MGAGDGRHIGNALTVPGLLVTYMVRVVTSKDESGDYNHAPSATFLLPDLQ